jgi:hypothetical protein
MKDDWRYCDTEDVIIEPIPLTDYAWMSSVTKLVTPKRLSAPKVRRKRLRKKVRKATNYSYGAYRKIYIQEEVQNAYEEATR